MRTKAGDVFKFAGHLKVYMVTSDVTSDGGGLATINFTPSLSATPAASEGITVTNVPFRVMMTDKVLTYAASTPLLYNFDINFTEAL